MPATFRAIAFVATELDARPGRTLRRAHRTMSEAELAEIVRVLRSVPESVAAWSDGTAGFDAFRDPRDRRAGAPSVRHGA